MKSELWRRPYRTEDGPALLAFCAQHPTGGYDASLRERFLTRLTTGPHCIVDLFEGETRVLVAAVIDTLTQPADAVIAEVMGRLPTGISPGQACMVLQAASAVACKAGRASVLSGWLHPLAPAVAARLEACGQRLRECEYKLERPPLPLPPAPPLPADWTWRDVDQTNADLFADLTFRAFVAAGIPLMVPAAEERRRALFAAQPRPRLLFDGNTALGIVRVSHEPGDPVGEVGQIARDPAYRGHGIGERLLAEALRLLFADGAQTIQLGVAAHNDRALALYRRFGFETIFEAGIYAGPAAAIDAAG